MPKKTLVIASLILVFSLFLPNISLQAQGNNWLDKAQDGGLNEIGSTAYDQTGAPKPLTLIIATIIKVFLGLLGIIFVILIIMAGFRWMTAGGNEESVKKASAQIKNATIGLIIIIAAYSLTVFISNQLVEVVSNNSIF